jgi:hypothetical protein
MRLKEFELRRHAARTGICEKDAAMNIYKTTVRVASPSGSMTNIVWAQVYAQNPFDAKAMLEAQYGRGNVIGTPTLVK